MNARKYYLVVVSHQSNGGMSIERYTRKTAAMLAFKRIQKEHKKQGTLDTLALSVDECRRNDIGEPMTFRTLISFPV